MFRARNKHFYDWDVGQELATLNTAVASTLNEGSRENEENGRGLLETFSEVSTLSTSFKS